MSKNSFLKGALILGIAGIIVKILGAFFRIPLGNIITSEGMGYYQTAYPVYVLLLTISSAGFPTAISKLVSERIAHKDHAGAFKIFKVSFVALIITGIVTSAILFFGADYIVIRLKNPKAYDAMVAISPALLFVPLMAAFRGYFQGRQEMTPTAVSQIIEQFARVILGLYLAFLFLPKGKEFAAAGASAGAAVGAVAGTLFMTVIYLKNKRKIKAQIISGAQLPQERAMTIIRKILVIAVPITIGSAIMPIMNMIDAAIVMSRLQEIGFTYSKANSLYGQLTGMAATLINLPQVLTMALAMSLVPVISHSYAIKDMNSVNRDVKIGIRVALLIGLPAAFGLASLSGPIMHMLYPKEPKSIGEILLFLSMGVIFLSLIQTLTGILQGMGKAYIPVINLGIGAIFKIVISYTLTGIPSLNVKGAAIGTIVAYAVGTILNLYYIKKKLKISFEFKDFVLKPFIAVIVMSLGSIVSYGVLSHFTGNAVSCLGAIAFGGSLYALVLLLIGGIREEEILMLPKGKKINFALKKAKIFK